jgi:hypothetical protein
VSPAAETVSGHRVLKSVCHGCHGGCSALLHVEDDVLTRIEGDPQGPLNHGALCPIGVGARDLVYHPDRLQYPLKRAGPRGSGQWERISLGRGAGHHRCERLHGSSAPKFGRRSRSRSAPAPGATTIIWVERLAYALGTPNWMRAGVRAVLLPARQRRLH